jgi:hypothetical protein
MGQTPKFEMRETKTVYMTHAGRELLNPIKKRPEASNGSRASRNEIELETTLIEKANKTTADFVQFSTHQISVSSQMSNERPTQKKRKQTRDQLAMTHVNIGPTGLSKPAEILISLQTKSDFKPSTRKPELASSRVVLLHDSKPSEKEKKKEAPTP